MIVQRIYAEFVTARAQNRALPALETSLNPLKTLRELPAHLGPRQTIQTCLLGVTILFSFWIMEVVVWAKIVLLSALLTLLLVPATAQFFAYSLPVLGWVFLFFNSKYIPLSMKRPITVTILPAVETIFYGDNLSQVLASYTCTLLDVLAWLPYGLIHFGLPFVVAILLFILAPPKTLRGFGWAFGFMNWVGVVVQDLLFPCAAPWYKVLHGLDKANYSVPGSPGGLGRIDTLIGFDLYTSNFTNSPLIFGAMPSLHSACATMDCLWLCYLFPRYAPLWCLYVLWLWFSTMYLTHHYFIDLVVGSCLAVSCFGLVKVTGHLPVNDKLCRWSYETEVCYDVYKDDPLANGESVESVMMEPLNTPERLTPSDSLDDEELRPFRTAPPEPVRTEGLKVEKSVPVTA